MANIFRRGNSYYCEFTVDGVRYRRSCRTLSKKIASEYANDFEATVRRQAIYGRNVEITFADAAKAYIKDGGEERFVGRLVRHFGARRLSSIKPNDVRDAARIIYPNAGNATRNRQAIVPAVAIINHASAADGDRYFRVERFPVKRKQRPAATREWINDFRRACLVRNNPALAAFALFIHTTGARLSQAINLTWDEVDLRNSRVRLWTGKTGPKGPERESHIAYLTHEMTNEILRLRGVHPTRVFGYNCKGTLDKQWARVIREAGLVKLTTHEAGRHAFATEMMVKHKHDPVTTAKMGGWKSARMLFEVYAHPDEGNDIANAVFGVPKDSEQS